MKTKQIVILAHFYDEVQEDGSVEPNEDGGYDTTPRLFGVYALAREAELALNLEIQRQEQEFLKGQEFERISGFTIMSAAHPKGSWVSVYKKKNPSLAGVRALAGLPRKSTPSRRKECV